RQTYLNLADWYLQLGVNDRAKSVLAAAPEKDDEMKYWLAYLHRNDENAQQWLDSANAGSPLFVFPFRQESYEIMQWATQQTNNWKPAYYLALLNICFENRAKALQILKRIASESNFAPLYVTLARLQNPADTNDVLNDYLKAASIDSSDWRYGQYLTQFLLSQKDYQRALQTVKPYFEKDNQNYIIGMLYAHCLMLNNKYIDAEKILDHIHILPFEGATQGNLLFRQDKLMLALQLLQDKKYQEALKKVSESREWPERLGEGKPYPDMINNTIQNEIEQFIRNTMQSHHLNIDKIEFYKKQVKAFDKTS
ncbi:MAG: tetratricopeptide repeat protein, partial [Chitinophagaceae bacterium]